MAKGTAALFRRARRRLEAGGIKPTVDASLDRFVPVPKNDSLILRVQDSGNAVLAPHGRLPGGRCSVTIEGQGNLVVIGEGTRFAAGGIRIRGNGNCLVIGPGARLGRGVISLTTDDCLIGIGAGTTWESGAMMATAGQSITLGDDCMLSNDVVLRTSDGHAFFDATSARRLNPPASVEVGHHVWIGNGARINKGSTVGDGSVVGQRTIVSGALDPHAVHAGVPARTIRRGVVWSRSEAFEDVPPALLRAAREAGESTGAKETGTLRQQLRRIAWMVPGYGPVRRSIARWQQTGQR